MPRRELGAPAGDRAPEALHLGRTRVVLEIDAELSDELDGEVGVGDRVDRAHDFFGVPRHAHLTSRVAGFEQAPQLRVSVVVQAFMCDRHQLADPKQRVSIAAPVAEGVVLDAAAGLVEHEVRQLDDVKWIGNLSCVREHRVEHRPIRARQIQRCPLDRLTPCGGLLGEPCAPCGGVATWDDIEELTAGDVNDLGRPDSMAELAESAEQHLIKPDRCRCTDAVRVIDQRSAMVHESVHHGVLVTAEIAGDLGDGSAMPADLERRPPASPVSDRRTLICDAIVDLDEGHHTAHDVRTAPALLRPDQAGPAAEARQIDEFDLEAIMQPHRPTTCRAGRSLGAGGDRDPQELGPVADTDHVDIGQANEQFAHARSIGFQQGLLGLGRRRTPPRFVEPLPAPADPRLPQLTYRSEAPLNVACSSLSS